MAKKQASSHTNKKVRELKSEMEFHYQRSRRSLRFGLLTLAVFIVLILGEQTLARLGVFGADPTMADNVTLGFLMLTAFVSVHFWVDYLRIHRKGKDCCEGITYYQS